MRETVTKLPGSFSRCAGPNCGVMKGVSDRWWIMWTSLGDDGIPVMHVAPWDEKLVQTEGVLPVCGEGCAQKLQSQFMGNVLEGLRLKSKS